MVKLFQFYGNKDDFFKSYTLLSKDIFSILDKKAKKHFAERIILYFDYEIVMDKDIDRLNALMIAIENAMVDLVDLDKLILPVRANVFFEGNKTYLAIFNYNESIVEFKKLYGLNIINENMSVSSDKLNKLKKTSWENLIYDITMTNYATEWFDFIPNTERRGYLQADYMINLSANRRGFKTLEERLEFKKDIKSKKIYEQIFNKVSNALLKIEEDFINEYIKTQDIILKELLVVEERMKRNKKKM